MNILFLLRNAKAPVKSHHNPGNNVCLLPMLFERWPVWRREGGKMWRNFTHIRQPGRRIWLGTIEFTKWPICLAAAVTWVVLQGLLGFLFVKRFNGKFIWFGRKYEWARYLPMQKVIKIRLFYAMWEQKFLLMYFNISKMFWLQLNLLFAVLYSVHHCFAKIILKKLKQTWKCIRR